MQMGSLVRIGVAAFTVLTVACGGAPATKESTRSGRVAGNGEDLSLDDPMLAPIPPQSPAESAPSDPTMAPQPAPAPPSMPQVEKCQGILGSAQSNRKEMDALRQQIDDLVTYINLKGLGGGLRCIKNFYDTVHNTCSAAFDWAFNAADPDYTPTPPICNDTMEDFQKLCDAGAKLDVLRGRMAILDTKQQGYNAKFNAECSDTIGCRDAATGSLRYCKSFEWEFWNIGS